ncbi:MAG: co-chaperone GroES [Candidatus Cloacimonetes bacterium 4572_55]|nr:MAG: co-chaperone GroES [Candidatus Cloacimonetes bacterium 4572_55]
MNLKPLADRVVVKPLSKEEKSPGGIIIPDTVKEKPSEGEVIAVGPGKVADNGERISIEVKIGDRVLFGKYSGTEFELKGEKYLIMRDNEIFATL